MKNINLTTSFVICFVIIVGVYFFLIKNAEAIPYYFHINILFITACFFIAEFNKPHLPIIIVLAFLGLTALDALYFYSDYDVNTLEQFEKAYIGATKNHFIPIMIAGSLIAIPTMIIREFILMRDMNSGWKRPSQKLYTKYIFRNWVAFEIKHVNSWFLKPIFLLKKYSFLLVIIGVGIYKWNLIIEASHFLNGVIFPKGLTFKSSKSIFTIVLLTGATYLILKSLKLSHILNGLLREIISLIKWSFLSGIIITLTYWLWRYSTAYDKVISHVLENDDLEPLYQSISNYLITTFIWVFCISAILIFFIRLFQSSRSEEYDKESDPWHPFNNEIKMSLKLQEAFNANLLEDNIEDILNVVEKGIADLHVQKRLMELMRNNWQSLPTLDDKTFNEHYNGSGARHNVFSRFEVANFVQTYNSRIFYIEENIKQCNELYNTLILKVPKHRGMTKPKDVKDFDGVNTTPMEDISKKIDGLGNTSLDDL